MSDKKKTGMIKGFFKSTINVKRWASTREIKASTKLLTGAAKDIFTTEKHEIHSESFEEALQRLNLSEEDLQQRQKGFFYSFLIYGIIGLGLLVYSAAIFIITGHFMGGVLSLVLGALALMYAYRGHFWYTQIKHRKLGVTFKEWLAFTFPILFNNKQA